MKQLSVDETTKKMYENGFAQGFEQAQERAMKICVDAAKRQQELEKYFSNLHYGADPARIARELYQTCLALAYTIQIMKKQ